MIISHVRKPIPPDAPSEHVGLEPTNSSIKKDCCKCLLFYFIKNGRDGGIRTHGITLPKRAL